MIGWIIPGPTQSSKKLDAAIYKRGTKNAGTTYNKLSDSLIFYNIFRLSKHNLYSWKGPMDAPEIYAWHALRSYIFDSFHNITLISSSFVRPVVDAVTNGNQPAGITSALWMCVCVHRAEYFIHIYIYSNPLCGWRSVKVRRNLCGPEVGTLGPKHRELRSLFGIVGGSFCEFDESYYVYALGFKLSSLWKRCAWWPW